MRRPIVILTDPNKEWAKVVRSAVGEDTSVTITSSEKRLKALIGRYPSGVLVIIDVRRTPEPTTLIEEAKRIHKNVVIIAATASRTWDDTVAYLKSGASDILYKTWDRAQISEYLRVPDRRS